MASDQLWSLATLLYRREINIAQAADILDAGRWQFTDEFGRIAGPASSKDKKPSDFELYDKARHELVTLKIILDSDFDKWRANLEKNNVNPEKWAKDWDYVIKDWDYVINGIGFEGALEWDSGITPSLNAIRATDERPVTRNTASQISNAQNNEARLIASMLSFIAGTHPAARGIPHPNFKSRAALIGQLTGKESGAEEEFGAKTLTAKRVFDEAEAKLEEYLQDPKRSGKNAMPSDMSAREIIFGREEKLKPYTDI
jgi:hypothetical protein